MSLLKILITAILVSIDAFFVGFYFGINSKFSIKKIAVIGSVIFLMCMTAYLFAIVLKDYVHVDLSYFSAALFLILGTKNLLDKEASDNGLQNRIITYKKSILLGVMAGTDGCIAAFSIAFVKETLLAPAIISVLHFSLICAGAIAANVMCKNLKRYKKISALSLLLLGALKAFKLI